MAHEAETCTCFCNDQECTVLIPFPKPESSRRRSNRAHWLRVLQVQPSLVWFQGKSQTICAGLFELERQSRFETTKRMYKNGKKWKRKQSFCGNGLKLTPPYFTDRVEFGGTQMKTHKHSTVRGRRGMVWANLLCDSEEKDTIDVALLRRDAIRHRELTRIKATSQVKTVC